MKRSMKRGIVISILQTCDFEAALLRSIARLLIVAVDERAIIARLIRLKAFRIKVLL